MKKPFLREAHNLQDKATKPDYRERFQDEGDTFDRGGLIRKHERDIWIEGNAICFNVRAFLNEDKKSLIQDITRHWKFHFKGSIGTVSQLMRNPRFTEEVNGRFEMTKRSLQRALEIVDEAKHPKKNRMLPLLEFTCFFEPAEPFTNPVFKRNFAFRLNIPKPGS